MLYIADISSIGVQHEQFNESFVKLLQFTFPEEDFKLFFEEEHALLLQNQLGNLKFQNVEIYNKRGGYKEFVRAYRQYRCLLELVKKAETEGATYIFILLIHPFTHFLFKQFAKSKVEVIFVLHGELESVKFNKHFVNKIWGWFLKRALSIHPTKNQYIVLGESIYQNLLKTLPTFQLQRAIVLDHPYPFNTVPLKTPDSGQIVISSMGVATLAKSSQYLFEVASEAANRRYQSLSFHICGRVYENMSPHLNEFVHYKAGFESLTRQELNSIMANSHFAVFYYNNSHYSLCSSGAFWDAVNAELPLLYLRNDYFDYYSEQVGPLGVAFNSPAELNEYVLSLGQKGISQPEYEQFVLNLRKLKNEFMSPERLAKQLKELPLRHNHAR